MNVQPIIDRNVLVSARAAWTLDAHSGSHKALAFLALIEYQLGLPSEETNYNAQNLLRRAMGSDDAEFLIELGEELIIGYPFFQNLRLAEECFKLALVASEVKGAYALGRFTSSSNRAAAAKFFQRAGNLGHFPSEVMADVGFKKTTNPFVKFAIILAFALRQRKRIEKALGSTDAKLKFWRYRDDFDHIKSLQVAIGNDRESTFPWSKPIPIKMLVALLKGTDSSVLISRRASISPALFMPLEVEAGTRKAH